MKTITLDALTEIQRLANIRVNEPVAGPMTRIFYLASHAIADELEEASPDEHPALVADLLVALDESVKLQSHYAKLLNMHDGGVRRPFASLKEWMERLRETKKLPTRT